MALALLLVAIALCCGIFIWHEKYEDKILGRVALGGMSIFSLILAADVYDGGCQLPASVKALLVCLFIFLARHAYRFFCWVYGRIPGWSGPNKQRSNP